jgi:outer membrane protein TolC
MLAFAALASLTASGLQAQTRDGGFTIIDAVERALEVHPTVRAAGASQQQAAAGVGQFTSARLPSLSLDGALLRYDKPMLALPIHGLDPTAFQFDRTLIQGTVRLGYTLWDGGARGSSIDAARTRESVASSEYQRTQMSITLDVATTYLRVLSAIEMLNAHDDGLTALRAERDRVQRLLAEGAAARIELLRVEAAIANAEAERTAVIIEIENARDALARALDLDLAVVPITSFTPVALKVSLVPPRDTIAALSMTSNPDLDVADRAVDAALSQRKAASAGWYPKFDVIGGLQLFGSGSGSFSTLWQAGLQVSYPLFLGGRRSSTVNAASASVEIAQYQYESTSLRVQEAIDRAVGSVRELRARVDALTISAGHLEEIVRIEQLTLDAGTGVQAEYLRAQANLRETRARLAQVRHTEIAARLELSRWSGDLDVGWLEQSLEMTP